jgi:nitroreductase
VDVIDAIRSRRMLPKVGPERPTRTQIEELLDLAVRAPSHHLTQPWRFSVLAGDERERLAEAIAEEATERGVDAEEAVADARRKVGRAPVIVVFTCIPSDEPGIEEAEELASVAMAIQNFLLAAHASGLAAMLRTGGVAYHPSVRRNLDLAPNERVVGFVYVGFPAGDRTLTERTSAGELTRWLGWDQ